MLIVNCPACRAASQVPDTARGKQVRCPGCQQPFRIPDTTNGTPAPPQAIAARPPAAVPAPVPAAARQVQTQPGRLPAAPRTAPELPPRQPRPSAGGFPVVWVVLGLAAVCVLLACGGVVLLVVFWMTPVSTSPSTEAAKKAAPLGKEKPAPNPPRDEPEKKEQKQPEKKEKEDEKFDPIDQFPREKPVATPFPVLPPPPPAALVITPATLADEQVVLKLPAMASAAVVGGGGRYLVFFHLSLHKVSVFDVSKCAFVKEAEVEPEDQVLIAAGADRLIVVYPEKSSAEIFRLPDLTRGAKVKLDMKVPPFAVAMGSASAGPLVVTGLDLSRLGETAFFDVRDGAKRIPLPLNPQGIFDITPQLFLRASSNGRLFTCQPNAGGVIQACAVARGELKRYAGNGSYPLPSADGRRVFTNHDTLSPGLKLLVGNSGNCVPAAHGTMYLQFLNAGPGQPRIPPGGVPVHLPGFAKPLVKLNLDGLDEPKAPLRASLPFDRRVHFVPDAKVIITIRGNGEEMVLHRFDPEAAFKKANVDYLYVASRPVQAARRGDPYRYALDVRQRAGGVGYELATHPPGMQISPQGEITWQVPANFPGPEADVRVVLRSGGRLIDHAFTIVIANR